MRRLLFLLCWLMMLASSMTATSIPYNQWWTQANRFYQQQQYDSAAAYYEKIAAQQPVNDELYYNLGNTYYRLNKMGYAVLYYKKALRNNPNLTSAKDNLELAQSRIKGYITPVKEIFFVNWWKAMTQPSLSLFWALATWFCFMAVVGILFWNRWKKQSLIHSGVSYAFAFLFFAFLPFAYFSAQQAKAPQEAVVMVSDAACKITATGKTETIPEGTVVTLETAVSGNITVTLPDGRTGIMRKDSLQEI